MTRPNNPADPDPRATTAVERRAASRYSVDVPVQLTPAGESSLHLHASQLSRNGCYIEMTQALSVGTRVRVDLSLGEHVASVRGCVITRHPQLGNGIMFLTFDGEGQSILRRFLAKRASD